ncbi:hypothetical protein HDG37_003586 [Paraburkholderia sp. MM5384-R2]|nr:hypothetical protein [Paraburkholderia sp. MM5384-R2]
MADRQNMALHQEAGAYPGGTRVGCRVRVPYNGRYVEIDLI